MTQWTTAVAVPLFGFATPRTTRIQSRQSSIRCVGQNAAESVHVIGYEQRQFQYLHLKKNVKQWSLMSGSNGKYLGFRKSKKHFLCSRPLDIAVVDDNHEIILTAAKGDHSRVRHSGHRLHWRHVKKGDRLLVDSQPNICSFQIGITSAGFHLEHNSKYNNFSYIRANRCGTKKKAFAPWRGKVPLRRRAICACKSNKFARNRQCFGLSALSTYPL